MSEGKQKNSRETDVDRLESEREPTHQPLGRADKISEGRRRFAKAGLLASPILMSVASRPVLGGAGVNCFSNALSGNLSNPDRGLCQTPARVDWTDANNWIGVPYQPDEESDGTPPESCSDCQKENPPGSGTIVWDEDACAGGTPFNTAFPFTGAPATSMYRILCESPGTDEAAAVEMLLYASIDSTYALRPVQVQHLYEGRTGIYAGFLNHFADPTSGTGGMSGYLEHTLNPPSTL